MTIYCARDFSVEDIQTIRDLIAQDQKLQRSALSRKLCQLWGWTKPNGEKWFDEFEQRDKWKLW